MRIAVIAWGSLIWEPRNEHGELSMAGDWQTDGPDLPVEFARISSDGRLTLVLVPGYPHLTRARWVMSRLDDLGEARRNLAARETNAPIDQIHGTGPDGPEGMPDHRVAGEIERWLGDRPYLDAAIWTGLGPGPRWGDSGWGVEQAVRHLASLEGPVRDRAIEYVRKAPRQVDTPIRRALQAIDYPSR